MRYDAEGGSAKLAFAPLAEGIAAALPPATAAPTWAEEHANTAATTAATAVTGLVTLGSIILIERPSPTLLKATKSTLARLHTLNHDTIDPKLCEHAGKLLDVTYDFKAEDNRKVLPTGCHINNLEYIYAVNKYSREEVNPDCSYLTSWGLDSWSRSC